MDVDTTPMTDAVNLRVHVPDVGPDEVAAQIDALGDVLARLRSTT